MIKINYPSDPILLVKFKDEYYKNIVNSGIIDEVAVNTILKTITSTLIDLKTILTSELNDLINLFDSIEKGLNPSQFVALTNHFVYEQKGQPVIASFFSNQWQLNMESCYYCNIDYIYAFKDYGEYEDGKDFLNRGHDFELLRVPYITSKILLKVKTGRPYNKIEDCQISPTSKNWLNNYPDNIVVKNHFTLDHVLPQADYQLLSLSLFNFVPSCYSCNSKFKRKNVFNPITGVLSASPTSNQFTINTDFEFILKYEGDLNKLNDTSTIVITQQINNNEHVINEYFEMFKIPGRYVLQKREARRLVDLMNNYPDVIINQIAGLTNTDNSSVKRSIYGKELFDDDLLNKPLTKFKRDIVKNLGFDFTTC